MRVIVPYVELRNAAVVDALNTHAPDCEGFYVGRSNTAYWRLLADLWATGEAFIVVEQDIEIHERVVSALTRCKQPWCGYAYNIDGETCVALGCTRFSSALLTQHPDVMERVGELYDGVVAKRDWHRLDSHIAQVLRDTYGIVQHAHRPAVVHHRRYD